MGDGAAAGTRIAANGRGQLILARAARQTKGIPPRYRGGIFLPVQIALDASISAVISAALAAKPVAGSG